MARDLTPEQYALFKKDLNRLVTEGGEWAGAPVPVHGLKLVLEKRYPFQGLNGFSFGEETKDSVDPEEPLPDILVRNDWYSKDKKAQVYIIEEKGKSRHFLHSRAQGKRIDYWINTLGASEAWSLKAEMTAMTKLKELVTPKAFHCYTLTGSFLETSKRSHVTYLFRKLRPTVALRSEGEDVRILATLCLHPIGYYENSWAGVLVPTDDILAHLILMRGDEHTFWKKANHHPGDIPEAGI